MRPSQQSLPLALLVIAAIVPTTAAPAHARKWTDTSGKFSIEAEFVGVEGNVVTLNRFLRMHVSFYR